MRTEGAALERLSPHESDALAIEEVRLRAQGAIPARKRVVRRKPAERIDLRLAVHPTRVEWSIWHRSLKRAMDIALSLIGLTLSLVAAPFIALAIWLEDGRPIFYVQTRVGLEGRLFNLWKFRTMLHGAEEHSGARWAQENDPRVTRVGSFLRSTHLDELPQFWSVLRGHMSLVGPRPERPELVAMLVEAIPGYASRTLVRPGITGVAQLQLGYVNSVEDSITKLRFDVAYITSSRLRTDLHCILRTIRLTVVDLARVCVKTVRNGKASGGAGRDGRQLPAGARSRSTPTESELL